MMATTASSPYAVHWSHYPLTYIAQRVSESIVIDGNHEKSVWQGVPWSESFGDIQGTDAPSSAITAPLTRFKALYDDNFLYFCALMYPSDEFATEAHFVDRNSPIFQLDSDFEIFLDDGSHHFYKEFEVNAINTVWNLMLDKPYNDNGHEHSARVAKPGESDYYEVERQESQTKIIKGTVNDKENPATWVLEVKMAFSDMGFGKDKPWLRLNLSRVEDKGNVNWTWQPQVVWDANEKQYRGKVAMHLPDAWGYLVLDTDSSNRDKITRDELWPAKLGALNVYYGQHAYRDEHGMFSNNMSELQSYVDPAIVKPLEILAWGDAAAFVVAVRMPEQPTAVIAIWQDRLLRVFTEDEWKKEEQKLTMIKVD